MCREIYSAQKNIVSSDGYKRENWKFLQLSTTWVGPRLDFDFNSTRFFAALLWISANVEKKISHSTMTSSSYREKQLENWWKNSFPLLVRCIFADFKRTEGWWWIMENIYKIERPCWRLSVHSRIRYARISKPFLISKFSRLFFCTIFEICLWTSRTADKLDFAFFASDHTVFVHARKTSNLKAKNEKMESGSEEFVRRIWMGKHKKRLHRKLIFRGVV